MSETTQLYMAEITVYDPDLAAERVLYLSTNRGFVTKPGDTPANVFFDPRIITPASVSIDVVSDGKTFGQGTINGGEMVLNNADGGLDWLVDAGVDGRSFVLRFGPEGGDYPADFATILTGTMEQIEFSWTRVTIRLRDRQAELTVPLQVSKYAGTNSGASGVEGLADDISGQPKPLCFGKCLNISPVAVNTTALILQVHDGAIEAIDAVYDKGVALTSGGADLANLAALQAASISGGQYRTCLALGLVRLGASPAGRVTADVRGDKTGGSYASTAGDIAKRILISHGGIDAGDVPSGVIAALNTSNSSAVGLYAAAEMTVLEALNAVLSSIGAWFFFDALGQFRAGVLIAPAGTPVATLTDRLEIVSAERIVTSDQGGGLPCYRTILSYGRNWTVQSEADLAGAVSDARRAYLGAEYRTSVATDTSVQTKHLLAPELSQQSLIVDAAAAATEAARRLDLYKVRRDYWQVRLQLDAGIAALQPGDVVSLVMDRFDYAAGRLMMVLGYLLEAKTNKMTLKLWG